MNDLDVLKRAREIIANQPVHVTEVFKEIVDGRPCYCLMGAIAIVFNTELNKTYALGGDDLIYTMSNSNDVHFARYFGFSSAEGIYHFNDTHTKEEVVAAFDNAIEQLEKQ